jgi:hypothetical protein
MAGRFQGKFSFKSSPKEKIRRPKNSTVIDRDQNSLSITVELSLVFFDCGFFSGCTFTCTGKLFFRVCMVGCMGRISHTNLKTRMVISRIATSKNHKELETVDLPPKGAGGQRCRGWQELTDAPRACPRAHFQIDGPRTVAFRNIKN